MRRLIVQEFMTLDGVMEAPGLEEHSQGRNGWALLLSDEAFQQYNLELFNRCGAILLGRVTYQIWEIWWPTANDDQGFAARVNSMPKYVVSNTLASVEWDNTTILRGDLGGNIRNLKAQEGGDILVNGSADLLAGLLDLGLIDEFRILLFPIVLGSGKRLFQENIDMTHLRLVNTQSFSSGVVLLTYEPRPAPDPTRYLADYAWSDEQILSLQAAQDVDRVLATVLFTDIVDSTARAAELGDRQWRRLLDRHDELARKEVARWHGELVKTTGDGILATFDAPTRALRCALRCGPVWGARASISAPASTPARSSDGAATSAGSGSISLRERSPRPAAVTSS
jgi:dihydrofolate reductase